LDLRFPVSRNQARGRPVGQMASKRLTKTQSAIVKMAPALLSRHETGGPRNDPHSLFPFLRRFRPQTRRSSVGVACPGLSVVPFCLRKPLIRLDSAKEIQGFEFGFRSAGFGFPSVWFGFRSEKFGFPSGGFGNPSSRGRVGQPCHARLRAESGLFLARRARLELDCRAMDRLRRVACAKVEHRRLGIAHEVLFSRPLAHGMQLETQINKSYVSSLLGRAAGFRQPQ
jgi:hypothetical protein